jgi:hypothetical protein
MGMSEGITIALIGFVGAILGAAIAGFAAITAAGLKKSDSQVPCGVLGLVASLGAAGGLVLGAIFGAMLMQQTPRTANQSVGSQSTAPIQQATQPSYDCMSIVSSSRPVTPIGTGDTCWLKLYDGAATTLTFNDGAQITFRTLTGGNDVFFFIAKKSDRLSDVVGATIRPMPFVLVSFGSLDNAKKFEIAYHSTGYQGGFTTCIRDANNANQPLNSLCK